MSDWLDSITVGLEKKNVRIHAQMSANWEAELLAEGVSQLPELATNRTKKGMNR